MHLVELQAMTGMAAISSITRVTAGVQPRQAYWNWGLPFYPDPYLGMSLDCDEAFF